MEELYRILMSGILESMMEELEYPQEEIDQVETARKVLCGLDKRVRRVTEQYNILQGLEEGD